MNLASVVLMLQLALTLLVTPNLSVSQQQQAQAFAREAVAIASESLNAVATSTPMNPYIPPISPIVGMEESNSASAQTPPTRTIIPSCLLTGTLQNVTTDNGTAHNGISARISFDWALKGIDASTTGKLYAWNPSAPNNPTTPWFTSSAMTLNEQVRNNSGLWGITVDTWKAVFGSATCYAFFHDPYQAGNMPYFYEGATSSPSPIETYQQSLAQ